MQVFCNRDDARKHCRQQRSELGAKGRAQASIQLIRRFRNSSFYLRAKRIAMYWPLPAEVDLRELAKQANADGKQVYLPVMQPNHKMIFARFTDECDLRPAAFGILEPRIRPGKNTVQPQHLDTVCVPLLGFDRNGGRLGMGGGYYDRCFGFRNADPGGLPRLVGVAFSVQELAHAPVDSWDLRLDAVITETEDINCVQRRNSL